MSNVDTSIFSLIDVPPIREVRFQNGNIPSALVNGSFYMVISTGALQKLGRDETQPKVSVSIKQVSLSSGQTVDEGKCILVSSVSGGFLRVGYVFQFVDHGRNIKVKYLRKYPRVQLKLNFQKEGWSVVRPDYNKDHFIPKSVYDISSPYDTFIKPNPYIKFKVSDYPGIDHVYISCFELFSRTYGSSSYLKRILLTFNYDSACEKLFEEYDVTKFDLPDQWTVMPHKRCNRADLPILAAMKYDDDTIRIISSIFHKILGSKNKVFPWISPWFQHQGDMTFSGLKLPENGFLGLRIDGISLPDHPIRLIKKVQRYDHEDGELVDGGQGGESGGPPKKKKFEGENFGVDQDSPPGEDSDTYDIEEMQVECENKPDVTVVEDVEIVPRPENDGNTNTDEFEEDEQGPVSPGEPTNDPTDNDEALISTPIELVSKGTLLEIWNDFIKLQYKYPEIILKVEHYNFQDGFSINDKPKLIAFKGPKAISEDIKNRYKTLLSRKSLNPQEEAEFKKVKKTVSNYKKAKKWLKLRNDDNRGLLVIRVTCSTVIFYCLESEREVKPDKSDEQDHYNGLYFTLSSEDDLTDTLEKALKFLPVTNGQIKASVIHEKIKYYNTYQHTRRNGGDYFFGHALKKITDTLGIDISIEVSVKPRASTTK